MFIYFQKLTILSEFTLFCLGCSVEKDREAHALDHGTIIKGSLGESGL